MVGSTEREVSYLRFKLETTRSRTGLYIKNGAEGEYIW